MHGELTSYDVFHTSLLHDANYAGDLELPIIQPTEYIPDQLIPFTHARATRGDLSGKCMHFYEHDIKFRCIWRNPDRYLPLFQRCEAIIGPDFSMYRNMPTVMQQWNCFKSRALSYWLQSKGITVIPNVRTSDEESFAWAFDGLPRRSVIAISSSGCCRHLDDRAALRRSVEEAVERLEPLAIVVNGSAPYQIFYPAFEAGIRVVQFDNQFSLTHKVGGIRGNR